MCSFTDCDKVHIAKGLCMGHYRQVYRGDELTSLRRYKSHRPCYIDGCDIEQDSHELCKEHSRRFRRYGDPTCDTQLFRVVNKIDVVQMVDGMSPCWLWLGANTPLGYGRIQNQYVHRYAYKEWVGPLVEGQEVNHLCAQRSCMNPDHLEQVTHSVVCQRAADRRRDRVRQP